MTGALPFLEGYSGQTTDELIALEGTYRTDSLTAAFGEAVRQKAEAIGLTRLTDAERTILAVEAIEREVNNGGYDQFFGNTPELVPIAVAALARIGCPGTAALTQRAIDALGVTGALTTEAIESVICEENESRSDELERCDEAFYRYPDGDIAARLLGFIRERRAEIGLPG
jgi:hypothetical protein